MTKEEKLRKYKQLRKELSLSDEKIKYTRFRKNFHPILANGMKIMTKLSGRKVFVIDNKMNYTEKPIIFAVTHIGKFDIELVKQELNIQNYLFSDDQDIMMGTFDDFFLRLSGIIYVDGKDKEDRKVGRNLLVKAINQGLNVMIFPEGIWNMTKNQAVMKCFTGAVDVAVNTNAEIVPIAIEQNDNVFYINIGKNIDVKRDYNCVNTKESIIDGSYKLRDSLATLKWQIWEDYCKERRDNIPNDYYQKFLEDRFREYPDFNIDIIESRYFKDKNIVDADEVYSFQKSLKPNYNNAFLYRNMND